MRTLGFGGSSNLNTSSSGLTTALQNQLSWFSQNNKHRLKLSSELRYDAYQQDQTTNLLGTFSYNSLADLAGEPAGVLHALAAQPHPERRRRTAALSLGDSYRRTSNLQIQYGLRLDANRFNAEPAYNADVEQPFGARNDSAPNALPEPAHRLLVDVRHRAADRRVRRRGARSARRRARRHRRLPEHAERESRLGTPSYNTGSPSAVQQLQLRRARRADPRLGGVRQRPGAIPSQCADGTTGTVFASTRRTSRCSTRTSSRRAACAPTSSGAARSSTTASAPRWTSRTR